MVFSRCPRHLYHRGLIDLRKKVKCKKQAARQVGLFTTYPVHQATYSVRVVLVAARLAGLVFTPLRDGSLVLLWALIGKHLPGLHQVRNRLSEVR